MPDFRRQTNRRMRDALFFTVVISLTVVPTWVMLQAGADSLGQQGVDPVQPLLLPTREPPPMSSPAPQAGPGRGAPQLFREVLKPRSVVDTSSRPVKKKKPKPKPSPVSPVDPTTPPVIPPDCPDEFHVEPPERPDVQRP